MNQVNAVELRPVTLADLVQIHSWERDPEVKRYLGGPVPEVDAHKWAAIAMRQASNAFSVFRRTDDRMVGWTLFQHSGRRGWELRIVIGKPFWHFGFGLQAAELALEIACGRGFEKIGALVHPEHRDSLALLRTLEFSDTGQTEHEKGVDCQIWSKRL